MPGPDPKANRRRANTPVKEANRVVLSGTRSGRAPEPRTDVDLHKLTRQMWREWWSSPMATQWQVPADLYALTRLALLYDGLYRTGEVSDKQLTEMRQIEARFGLDPKGRKELGWSLADKPAPEKPKSSPSPAEDELAKRRRAMARDPSDVETG